ncbi:MAG TPA: peptidase M28, partial [Blastocatellia bacterium]
MKRSVLSSVSILVLGLSALGSFMTSSAGTKSSSPTFSAIGAATLMDEIKTLSSDEFEGRAPGTHGEDLSIHYVADQFKKVGLQPGNPDGT